MAQSDILREVSKWRALLQGLGATSGHVWTADGAGGASFQPASGGTTSPGGVDTQMQYNDGGVFGGTSGLTWDDAANTLQNIGDTIAGDPGFEGSGIDLGGTIYDSVLKVSDIGSGNLAQFILHQHSTTDAPVMVAARSNSDTSAHALVVDDQILFSLLMAGWDGNDYKVAGQFRGVVDGTAAAGDMPGRWEFITAQDGGTTQFVRLTINSLGEIVSECPLFIVEQSGANADRTGYGQIYVDQADDGLYYKYDGNATVRLDVGDIQNAGDIATGIYVRDPTTAAPGAQPAISFEDNLGSQYGFISFGDAGLGDTAIGSSILSQEISIVGQAGVGGQTIMVELDPDDAVRLFHNTGNAATRELRVATEADGVLRISSNDSGDPGSGGAYESQIRFTQTTGITVGEVGYRGGQSVLDIANSVNSGIVRLLGASGGAGANREMLIARPLAEVELWYAGVNVAETLPAASGGFQVNNTLTGAGFERVLTASDLGGGTLPAGTTDGATLRYDTSSAAWVQNILVTLGEINPPTPGSGQVTFTQTATVDKRRPNMWVPAASTVSTVLYTEWDNSPEHGAFIFSSGSAEELIIGVESSSVETNLLRFQRNAGTPRVLYNGTTANDELATLGDISGAAPVALAADGADSATSDTTLTDDTDLNTFVLDPDQTYTFEAFIRFDTAGAGGARWAFQVAAGATTYGTYSWFGVASDGPRLDEPARDNVTLGSIETITITAGESVSIRIHGTVRAGGSGATIDFQFAQNVSDASATNRALGSWVRFTPINSV